MAEGTILVPDEPAIGQLLVAQFAAEAMRMPIGGHCFDDPSNHEFTAFVAARSKEDVEVTLAVLPALKLVENAVWESAETLGASKNM